MVKGYKCQGLEWDLLGRLWGDPMRVSYLGQSHDEAGILENLSWLLRTSRTREASICERSQEGFFTIWASGNKFLGEGGGNRIEGTEGWQSIRQAPMPKGAFTATEEVDMSFLWIHILVLSLTGMFWGLRKITYIKYLNDMCWASGISCLSPGVEVWTLLLLLGIGVTK